MKRGEMINRGIAAAITLWFMVLVRPDIEPGKVEAAFIAILMYEGLSFSIRFIRRTRKKNRIMRNNALRKEDGKRWAEEKIYWPMYEEVS